MTDLVVFFVAGLLFVGAFGVLINLLMGRRRG